MPIFFYRLICLGMCLDILTPHIIRKQFSTIFTAVFCYVCIDIHSSLNIRMS